MISTFLGFKQSSPIAGATAKGGLLAVLCVTLAACAGAAPQTSVRDARAAGGSPTYRPLLHEFAYGRPQPGVTGSATRSSADLDAFLLPARTRHASVPRSVVATRETPTAASAAIPPRVAETPPAVDATQPAAARPELAANDANVANRYAAREARSQVQQDYRGGDVLVITASTLVIVLLVVLLIVLLVR